MFTETRDPIYYEPETLTNILTVMPRDNGCCSISQMGKLKFKKAWGLAQGLITIYKLCFSYTDCLVLSLAHSFS